MNAYVASTQSADKETLISVTFERESPDPNSPTIEVVFEYVPPQEYSLTEASPGTLIQRSVTRTDTRETITLTPEEQRTCRQLAAEKSGSLSPY